IYLNDLENKIDGFFMKKHVTSPFNANFSRKTTGVYTGIKDLYLRPSDFQTIIKHLIKPLDVNNDFNAYVFELTYAYDDVVKIPVPDISESVNYQTFLESYSKFSNPKNEIIYCQADLEEKNRQKDKISLGDIKTRNKILRKTLLSISEGRDKESVIKPF